MENTRRREGIKKVSTTTKRNQSQVKNPFVLEVPEASWPSDNVRSVRRTHLHLLHDNVGNSDHQTTVGMSCAFRHVACPHTPFPAALVVNLFSASNCSLHSFLTSLCDVIVYVVLHGVRATYLREGSSIASHAWQESVTSSVAVEVTVRTSLTLVSYGR